MQDHQQASSKRFLICLLTLSFLYLSFELIFNCYAMFSADEFWVAHHAYQFKSGLPYRDFSPYKTVLGYYFILLPMLITHGLINTLITIKQVFAVVNAIIFVITALWLTRYFSRRAIIASLSLLLFSEMVLIYSTNIRIDLIAYWFGLFSILFLLEKRYLIAGVLLGIGFAVSQKIIWYIAASDIALITQLLLFNRTRSTINSLLLFNLAAFIPILFYIAVWSFIAGTHVVLYNVFYEATVMYQLDWYARARPLFWSVITLHNPLLIFLWPFTFISLFVTYPKDKRYHNRFFITIYALAIFAFLIPYKQIFPYYMQVTYPVLLVLYAAFFNWLIELFNADTVTFKLSKLMLAFLTSLYIITVYYVIYRLHLPFIYALIIFLAAMISGYCLLRNSINNQIKSIIVSLSLITIIFTGLIYPLILLSNNLIFLNGQYQKVMLTNMQHLLDSDEHYVAGIELLYNQSQPIPGLRHLMGTAVDYLYSPTTALRKAMIASLYEDPTASIKSVIQHLNDTPVKLYINNYRMNALPPTIKNYLAKHYVHFWGSIYLYAPLIDSGHQRITIPFAGNYSVETNEDSILIDNHRIKAHSVFHLDKRAYQSDSKQPFRLRFIPHTKNLILSTTMQKDEWQKVIF